MPAKPERRRQILAAAAKLFRERGYQATTMDDLAAKLKLNKATVYHHFSDGKADLLFQIYMTALDELSARVKNVDTTLPPVERLGAYIATMITLQVDIPDETIVYFQERPWLRTTQPKNRVREFRAREQEFADLVRTAIEDGVERGDFECADPPTSAAVLVEFASTAHNRARPTDTTELVALIDFYTDAILNGLAPVRKRARARAR